ncbi:MAG: hypothetical protein EAZ95_00570 [Bacteroidetes bacterium]|nr:MAG: hypothetical protein EAZ95_00570 [Bacteroidota bacterium]
MTTILCPYCNQNATATEGSIGSLPPTGGDYEWQESDQTHTCPHCSNSFTTRVRTSLETGKLLFVNNSPKPQQAGIVWYAVASVKKSYWGGEDEKSVYVSALCQDEATAQTQLEHDSKKHYEPLQILKVTQAGYFDLAGEEIIEASYNKDRIQYLDLS